MKLNLKRIFSALSAASVLLCAASCSSPDEIEKESETEDTSVTTYESETESIFVQDSLPALDFNGEEMKMLVRDEFAYEFISEQSDADIVNDAVFERNLKVEERLGIKLKYLTCPGDWDLRDQFITTLRASIQADEDAYDTVAGYAYYITNFVLENAFIDLNNVDYLDFSMPWWSQDAIDELTVNGKMFLCSGDITLTMIQYTIVNFFNRTLFNNLGLESPYDLVINGEWTLDKLQELAKAGYYDLNANGKIDNGDRFGYVIADDNHTGAHLAAFDQPVTVMNSEGFPELAINSEKMISIVERFYDFLYNNDEIVGCDPGEMRLIGGKENMQSSFANGRSLITSGYLVYTDQFRDMREDYGVLPLAKLDEHQESYYTSLWDGYSLMGITSTCRNIPLAGAALEALCSEGYRSITPAYYETALKIKYARDDETSQMLDLIRSGIRYNFGSVYTGSIASIGNILKDITYQKQSSFTSYYAKIEGKTVRALENLVEQFEKLS